MASFALLDGGSDHRSRSSTIVSRTSLDFTETAKAEPENARTIKTLELVETEAVGSKKRLCTYSAHRAPQMELDWSEVGLVGRKKTLHALQRAIFEERQSAVFVHGESGVGKTALLQHFLKRASSSLSKPTILCGTGKYDQYAMECLPFDPILQALGQVIRRVIRLPVDQRRSVQARVHSQIDQTQQRTLQTLVRDSVGLWNQDVPSRSSGRQTDEWYHYSLSQAIVAVRALIRALTSDSSTFLVVLLDDMHWATKESVDLVRDIFHNPADQIPNVTLMTAFREETVRVRLLRDQFIDATFIPLAPWDLAQTNDLITKILKFGSPDDTKDLAEIVFRKTHGNPEFCRRFLDHLLRSQFLVYSFTKFSWEWDLDKIRHDTNVTDNVVEVLKQQMNQFGPQGLAVLQLAACLGFYFDSSFLKEIVLREGILKRNNTTLRASSMANVVMEVMKKTKEEEVTGQKKPQVWSKRAMIASVMRESMLRKSRYHDLTRDVTSRKTAEMMMFSALLERIQREGFIERSSDWQFKVRRIFWKP